MSKKSTIKSILEKLYKKYNHRNLIKPDPLQFVYNYTEPLDMEIAGLVSASLAYGRVEQIQKDLMNLFKIIGTSPYEYVMGFNKTNRNQLRGFKHRFNTGNDISDLFEALKIILKKYGSLENCFLHGYSESDENIIHALSNFCDSILDIHKSIYNGNSNRSMEYLIVSPVKGSACKRMNLFLRWMVRKDNVDSGIWKSIDTSKLIVPIDVHMGRLSSFLGFHDKKNISLKTAVQITDCFAKIEPSDPVKYDFALSRIGIVENCTGKYGPACELCELNTFCRHRQK